MNEKDIVNKLASVIDSLNRIEVRGKSNLLNLVGCITAIEGICQELIITESDKTDK